MSKTPESCINLGSLNLVSSVWSGIGLNGLLWPVGLFLLASMQEICPVYRTGFKRPEKGPGALGRTTPLLNDFTWGYVGWLSKLWSPFGSLKY